MDETGTKISELQVASALGGTEAVPVVQSGDTKRATPAQMAAYIKTGLSKSDVGLGNVDNVRQYSASNPPPTPSAADVGAVPISRTVNGKALSSDISLTASDVGAATTEDIPGAYASTPAMDGAAAPGSSGSWARGDHVHPTDTSRQAALTWDNAPTDGSTNPVKSGGIYDAILRLYPTDTATGAPANFPDGADGMPVADLKVNIDLAQAGSGTPSPANVRPITPWTGLTVYHSGADTTDPEELAVSWAADVGPVYAGELDVTGGVLSEAYYDASQDALSMVVTGNTPNNTVQARFRPALQEFEASSAGIISDRFSNSNGSGQPGMIARVNLGDGAWIYLNIPQSELSGTTTAAVQAWAAAKQPVILLKRTTPVTHQITPEQLVTLLGENNIWSDAGDVTVEYRADVALYIDKRTSNAGTLSLGATPSMIRPATVEMQTFGLDEEDNDNGKGD